VSPAHNVRSARSALARALAEEPHGAKEAEEQLRTALLDAGERPADWEIYHQLGGLLLRVRNESAALAALVSAVVAAPREFAGSAAEQAIDVLDGSRGAEAVSGLPLDTQERLIAHAKGGGCLDAARLAARIAMIQGDTATVASIAGTLPEIDRARDPALVRASVSARASVLLDEFHVAEALDLLERQAGSADDPAVMAVWSSCLYAAGRLDEALAKASDGTTMELSTLVALIWLRRAADTGPGDERAKYIGHALTAAAAAAREDPARPESLLLRAQVLLEGAGDLNEGRRLLKRALHRLEQRPEQLSWWRLQARVREDELYRFFLVELAVAQGQEPEIIAAAERVTFATTEFAQDGAVHRHWGEALLRRGERERAATHFQAACRNFTTAGDPLQAGFCMSQAAAVSDTPDLTDVLTLVEDLWTSSSTSTGDDASERLDLAARLLEQMDRRVDERHAARICLLRGLVAVRHLALSSQDAASQSWGPLPHLLLAAEAEPDASYSAAHLAWALSAAELNASAAHYAERAFAIDPEDLWLQDLVTVTRFNWLGELDGPTAEILEGFVTAESSDDPSIVQWRDTVVGFAALLAGDLASAGPLVDRMTHDRLWGRWARANAVLRCRGLGAARELFEQLRVECQQGGKHGVIPWLLLLTDPERVPEELDCALRAGQIGPAARTTLPCLYELIRTSGSADAAALDDVIRMTVRPLELRELAEVTLLGIAAAYPDRGSLVDTMRNRATRATARADTLAGLPALTAEIDSGWSWCADAHQQATVRLVLDGVAAPGDDRSGALARLLSGLPAAQLALPQACAAAASVIAKLRVGSVPARAEGP